MIDLCEACAVEHYVWNGINFHVYKRFRCQENRQASFEKSCNDDENPRDVCPYFKPRNVEKSDIEVESPLVVFNNCQTT